GPVQCGPEVAWKERSSALAFGSVAWVRVGIPVPGPPVPVEPPPPPPPRVIDPDAVAVVVAVGESDPGSSVTTGVKDGPLPRPAVPEEHAARPRTAARPRAADSAAPRPVQRIMVSPR